MLACVDCGVGKFQASNGQNTCDDCPGGKVSREDPTARNDCDGCGAGQFSPGGQGACEECEGMTYSDGAANAACSNCDANKVSDAGWDHCQECPPGRSPAGEELLMDSLLGETAE